MAKPPAPNIVDRLVGFFSPVAGLQRFGARHALEKISASSRAHEASSPARSRKFYTDRLSPNQIVLQGAGALMAQARHMERNNDIARGILRTMTNNIVGPNGIGIEPQPRRLDGSIHEEYAAALRAAHREWRAAPEVTGLHTDAAMQRLCARTWLRDGEVFAQELTGPVPGLTHGSAVPYSLEMFEADLVPLTYDQGERIRQGIERNAWGKPTAYYSYKGNPLEGTVPTMLGTSDLKRIPAASVIHVALRDRIGQMRGISEFASIISRLEDIKDYEDSERIAAKVAAALTAFVKKTNPEGYDPSSTATDENGNVIPRDLRLTPGMIIDGLAVGEEIGLIDSNRPNPNVVTFRQGQLRAVAAGVGASYSSIARDYNGTYSAQRQELVEQWINYASLTDAFTGLFVQPCWNGFVVAATYSGRVPVPKDVKPGTENDALFIAQAMPWIDPMKEAEALVVLTKAGFASEVEAIRRRGGNPRDVLEQITQWRKEAKRADLILSSDAANDKGVNPQPETPKPDAEAVKEAQANAKANQQAILGMATGVMALAQREQAAPNITLPAPVINMNLPEQRHEIHNHLPEQNAPVVNVTTQAPNVNVENIVTPQASAAPVIHITNEVQPAPVTVNNTHPSKAVQTVERDANDEIVSTTTVYEQ